MSESFCEMLGLQRADLIGRSAEDITPADFVDLAAVREEIRRCEKKIGFWIYIRRDGRYVLVRYSIRVRADRMADLYLEPFPMAS
jgi:PAS domain S-box-containing protein